MQEGMIWALSGAVLFLLVCLLISFYERNRLRKGIRQVAKESEKSDKVASQAENLLREKELLEFQLQEAKKSEEKNRKIALYDYVTGLPNYLALTELLEGTIKTLRKEETLGLIYIDLEYSENPDRQISHAYRDELLVDVTDRLRQVVDENDLLSCVDGDRFIILVQNMESQEAVEEKVKRIQKVFSYPFVLAATEVFMNASMGICLGPRDGKTAKALLKNLDTALFAARQKGRNQYCYFEESLSQEMMSRIELRSQLRAGLENKEFAVYYQPQVDIRTEKLRGFEALLRWKHPTRGMLLPEAFLPIAEETGFIVPIGKWLFLEACAQLAQWQEEGYGELFVSVSLSLRQLREKELISEIREALEKTEVEPSQLLIELSGQAAAEEPSMVMEQAQQLEKLGIRIILDDVGLGALLQGDLGEMPVCSVKLGSSFVQKEDSRLATVFMAAAKAYGLSLAADGVERESQKKLLGDMGCSWAQGALYSEPVTAAEAEAFLNW